MNKRQYKKAYWICKDDDGKMIYAGDTVELLIPYETSKSYTSIVYWDRLYGALVDKHPAHRWMEGGSKYRRLSEYLNQDKRGIPVWDHPDDENPSHYKVGFCRKVKNFYEN